MDFMTETGSSSEERIALATSSFPAPPDVPSSVEAAEALSRRTRACQKKLKNISFSRTWRQAAQRQRNSRSCVFRAASSKQHLRRN